MRRDFLAAVENDVGEKAFVAPNQAAWDEWRKKHRCARERRSMPGEGVVGNARRAHAG